MTKDSDEGIALESSALETLYGDKFTYVQRTRAAYLFLITLHQGGLFSRTQSIQNPASQRVAAPTPPKVKRRQGSGWGGEGATKTLHIYTVHTTRKLAVLGKQRVTETRRFAYC